MKRQTTQTEFTRRMPAIPKKELERSCSVAKKLIHAWDVEGDADKVKRIFFKYAKMLCNPHYWELLRTVWVVAGSTDNADEFRPYFNSKRPCRGWFMTVEDAKELDDMVFPMKVYRAYKSEPDPGISWSTDLEFVKRYANGVRQIKERVIEREDVFAYISRRHESEIIIL